MKKKKKQPESPKEENIHSGALTSPAMQSVHPCQKNLLTPGFKSEADAVIFQGMEKEWSKEKDVGLVFKRQNYIVANHNFLSHVRASQMLAYDCIHTSLHQVCAIILRQICTLAKVLSWWLWLITNTHLLQNELASSDTPSQTFMGPKVFLQVNTVVLQHGSFYLFIKKSGDTKHFPLSMPSHSMN